MNIDSPEKTVPNVSREIRASFQDAINRVTEELKKEGFGILTQIDVKATLKAKLGVDYKNYVILGACNPPLAYKALQAMESVGLMLPCNVVVMEKEPGLVQVLARDPSPDVSAMGNPALMEMAEEVKSRMTRVLEGL
jgi:uncharacterized protein (DUF302 family)